MDAFDFILVLFSFVYAAAVTQLLSTGGRNLMRHRAGLYHFVIAVWIAKRQNPPLQQKVHR
jgi:hypothetical protein